MTEDDKRTSDLERRTDALEAAEHLAHALEENTTALDRVRKRYRLTLALIALVAATLFAELKFNYDGNVSQCRSGNALREQIDAKWDAITGFLDEAGVDDDAEGVAFLNLLTEDLEKRDCTNVSWLGNERD